LRLNLCQFWNLSPAELDQQDARRLLHDTELILLHRKKV
jgi:hypothetical protein